jgi:hypothetical protein
MSILERAFVNNKYVKKRKFIETSDDEYSKSYSIRKIFQFLFNFLCIVPKEMSFIEY